jgi:hypothetical protein
MSELMLRGEFVEVLGQKYLKIKVLHGKDEAVLEECLVPPGGKFNYTTTSNELLLYILEHFEHIYHKGIEHAEFNEIVSQYYA